MWILDWFAKDMTLWSCTLSHCSDFDPRWPISTTFKNRVEALMITEFLSVFSKWPGRKQGLSWCLCWAQGRQSLAVKYFIWQQAAQSACIRGLTAPCWLLLARSWCYAWPAGSCFTEVWGLRGNHHRTVGCWPSGVWTEQLSQSSLLPQTRA